MSHRGLVSGIARHETAALTVAAAVVALAMLSARADDAAAGAQATRPGGVDAPAGVDPFRVFVDLKALGYEPGVTIRPLEFDHLFLVTPRGGQQPPGFLHIPHDFD